MSVSKILFASFAALLIFGCVQQQPPPPGNLTPQPNITTPQPPPIPSLQPAMEQCAVAEIYFDEGEFELGLVKPSISEDVRCTGSLSKYGTLQLKIVDSKNPQRPVHVFWSSAYGNILSMCRLTKEELEEVKRMPDVFSQKDYCSLRNNYYTRCNVESGSAPNLVVLKCGNESVVGEDSGGYYNMYVATFMVGERVDVVDPQTGEINQTASQRVHNDESCQFIDPFFHSYNCGVNGAFVAIPR